MEKKLKINRFVTAILFLVPILLAFLVWFSALSFVPVPWPDDSAFYFVAKHLFQWPPRWVMLPQAPFEPTYKIFNFNTMPLYPILIGLGRWIGVDGSFLLKLWPLSAWALTGSILSVVLFRKGLPWMGCLLIGFLFGLDPELRWASVLVRPESLIGLFGMVLVLGLTFGFPKKWEPRNLWDPVSALLALGAYSHFNALHLVFPVIACFVFQPQRLMKVASKTLLYLSPWLVMVIYHFDLFVTQMSLQWTRFAARNDWLDTPTHAIHALFQSMGSPEPWPGEIQGSATCMWILFIGSVLFFMIGPCIKMILRGLREKEFKLELSKEFSLLPALSWVIGAALLFHSKPEVWFMYYFHASLWCLCGLICLYLWKKRASSNAQFKNLSKYSYLAFGLLLVGNIANFAWIDVSQALQLQEDPSWHWKTYHEWVDCIDEQLTELEERLGHPKPFKVWCPTFPDTTVELSLRHPDWELTRTNDFWTRFDLGVQHGWEAHAVVVNETLNHDNRFISGPQKNYPEIQSNWMLWKGYFLNRLWTAPNWKPNRYLCQKARWQAFIFMN